MTDEIGPQGLLDHVESQLSTVTYARERKVITQPHETKVQWADPATGDWNDWKPLPDDLTGVRFVSGDVVRVAIDPAIGQSRAWVKQQEASRPGAGIYEIHIRGLGPLKDDRGAPLHFTYNVKSDHWRADDGIVAFEHAFLQSKGWKLVKVGEQPGSARFEILNSAGSPVLDAQWTLDVQDQQYTRVPGSGRPGAKRVTCSEITQHFWSVRPVAMQPLGGMTGTQAAAAAQAIAKANPQAALFDPPPAMGVPKEESPGSNPDQITPMAADEFAEIRRRMDEIRAAEGRIAPA